MPSVLKSLIRRLRANRVEVVVLTVVLASTFALALNLDSIFKISPRLDRYQNMKMKMRDLATALEAYAIDHQAYPAWSADPRRNQFALGGPTPKLAGLPTFALPTAARPALATLTTPMQYLKNWPVDTYAPVKNAPYCYYVYPFPPLKYYPHSSWILWSAGPDGVYDLTLNKIGQALDPLKREPTPLLKELTYDPSNGSRSRGDVWRLSQ